MCKRFRKISHNILCRFQLQDDFLPTAEAEIHQRLKEEWSSEGSFSDDSALAGGWKKVSGLDGGTWKIIYGFKNKALKYFLDF